MASRGTAEIGGFPWRQALTVLIPTGITAVIGQALGDRLGAPLGEAAREQLSLLFLLGAAVLTPLVIGLAALVVGAGDRRK